MRQEYLEFFNLAQFLDQTVCPKTIVEIGTKHGGTLHTFCMIAGINYVSSWKVISIDLPMGIHGGLSKEIMNDRNKFFIDKFSNHVNFITGNSQESSTKNELIKQLNNRQIDFLFIDGDHRYNAVKKDFEMYSPLVRKGGYIGFHDINDTNWHRSIDVYVAKFWNELEGNKLEFNTHSFWAGIGIIEKKT